MERHQGAVGALRNQRYGDRSFEDDDDDDNDDVEEEEEESPAEGDYEDEEWEEHTSTNGEESQDSEEQEGKQEEAQHRRVEGSVGRRPIHNQAKAGEDNTAAVSGRGDEVNAGHDDGDDQHAGKQRAAARPTAQPRATLARYGTGSRGQRTAFGSTVPYEAPRPRRDSRGSQGRADAAGFGDGLSLPRHSKQEKPRQAPRSAQSHSDTEDVGSLVAKQLEEAHIHELVSQCIQELAHTHGDALEGVTPHLIKEKLRQKGLIDEVLARLNLRDTMQHHLGARSTGQRGRPEAPGFSRRPEYTQDPRRQQRGGHGIRKQGPPRSDQKYLHLAVLGGSAFIEQQEFEEEDGATLQLQVRFRDQRFSSQRCRCSCEPAFHEDFYIALPSSLDVSPGSPARGGGGGGGAADVLFRLRDPIHVVITRQSGSHRPREVVASHHLDWRPLVLGYLMNGRASTKAVKVNGVGAAAQLPAGVLHIRMAATPAPLINFDPDQVAAELAAEAEARLLQERRFVLLAQRWWDEYVAIRPSHRRRLVKLFASDENASRRPVCVCLQRIKPSRTLETPGDAARFVSLLPYQRREISGGLDTTSAVRWEQWSTTFAFLCAGQGDVEDHALLLAGLLLEFGLDAYVCLGTKQSEDGEGGDGRSTDIRNDDDEDAHEVAYAWAMVKAADEDVVWFFDPITGKQYQHWRTPHEFAAAPAHPFLTIDCVFNETLFAANSQPSNHIDECCFDLSVESDWKRLSSDVILDLRHIYAATQPLTLEPTALDPFAAAEALEKELRALIKEHRRHDGLSTRFDASLEQSLTPALVSYEMESVHGCAVGNDLFKLAVKHKIPRGHSFKGFPFEQRTLEAAEALRECQLSFVGQDILDAHGDQVWHAVRCRVNVYPEDAVAVWVMIACRFLSIAQ